MNFRTLTSLAAAAGLWLGGYASAQEPARLPAALKMSNQELANSVAAQLQSGSLRGYAVDISCKDGVVELTGRVADGVQREQVIRTALAVPGVKSVVDGITVNAQGIRPVQALTQADPSVLPAPIGGAGPIVDPLPVAQPLGAAPYDLNPPKLPPYAWPWQ